MATTVFPVAVASSSGVNATNITATAASTQYSAAASFDTGVYTITCLSSVTATVTFMSNNTEILTTQTSSGTVTVNLATPITSVFFSVIGGTSVLIQITKIANAVSSDVSNSIEEITSSTTYTNTSTSGFALVVLVGGGGGGGAGSNFGGSWTGGTGGAGGQSQGVIQLTGSVSVIIGSAGAGATAPNSNGGTANRGSTGGTTSFGSLSATGGTGGISGFGNYDAFNGGSGAAGSRGTPATTRTWYGVAPTVNAGNGGSGTQTGTGNAGSAGKVWLIRY